MIVAIDGPAASGKSTTARAIADHLGFIYLDTGAMYRTLALAALRYAAAGWSEPVVQVLQKSEVEVAYADDGEMRIFLDGEDVSEAIRQPEVGTMASRISARADIRDRMVALQRKIGQAAEPGVVVDGRDIGTVVFPDAPVKVFLTADLEERARRRQEELQQQGQEVSRAAVRKEVKARDRADRERAVAPLRQAADAVVVDTTHLNVQEQVQAIVDLVHKANGGHA
ncbi:MAG: (d)CMP kinase [Bacteroidetes bacterium]|nr:(d)CMP kinase [Bacteroidota bacterium]